MHNEPIFQKRVLNFREVVSYTGWKPSFIYKLTSSGKLKHSKPNGKTLFFLRSDVEDFLMSNPIATADSIAAKSASYVVSNGGR